MQIEIRNLGIPDESTIEVEIHRALGFALKGLELQVERVRVRLLPSGTHGTICRIRAWCGSGPTVVIESRGATTHESLYDASATLAQALWHRRTTTRARRHHGSPRRDSSQLSRRITS